MGGSTGIPIVDEVIDSGGDLVNDAVNTVTEEVIEPTLAAVDNVVDKVNEEVVDPVTTAVDKTVTNIMANPLQAAAIATATVTGQTYLIPYINAGFALDAGMSPEDALKQAAISYAATEVGTGVGAETGSSAAGAAASGVTSGILRGQDPLTALVQGGITAGTASITAEIPGFDQLSPTQQAMINNTVSTALKGGDPSQALVNTALNAGLAEAKAQYRSSGLSAGATGQTENVFDPSYGGALPTTAEAPSGTQVASTDGALPTVSISGSPIYAESSSASSVTAPFGYDLMPASMSDQKPEGAYYDQFQNAWFMPNQDAQNLQTALQNQTMPEATTIPDGSTTDTITDAGALPTTSTTEEPIDEIPEIVVTAPRDPYTGDIEYDLSGQPITPTTTTPTATAVPTGTSVLALSAASPITGGSNVGQTTSAAPSLGALPTAPTPTMLSAAPLEKQNMVLSELTQLYPQLANVDPRLLQVLSGRAKPTSYYNYGQSSSGTTPLMNAGTVAVPSAGVPFKTASSPTSNIAGLTSATGSGALSRAGLSMLDSNQTISGFAKGGLAEHNPEFITGATGHHVKGAGDGQSDSIPAMLADGEYVFDADTVAALGNGSNDAGARILDKMRQNLRKHKRSAPAGKIPPKAKSPLEYMKG